MPSSRLATDFPLFPLRVPFGYPLSAVSGLQYPCEAIRVISVVGAVLRNLVAEMPLAVRFVVPVTLRTAGRLPLRTLMFSVLPQAPILAD